MKSVLRQDRLQIWGGIECTVNRVGDDFHDQLQENGHDRRDDDIDRFADLGFDALRYPVLWERTAPNNLDNIDWSWLDLRLSRLRELKVAPIAGLVHHGSGPRHTNLLDDNFPVLLAEYAATVAARYPWLEAYTPVNEPLTTARFSGLYGHWYPHGRSALAFATALIHQCLGIALSMRAIRRVNTDAKLVLTEDLAKTHCTPCLAEQAAFENHRRWLSIDLLLGRVNRQHALWGYLAQTPRLKKILLWLVDEPCAPDILGFNYYLTSERFLDERLDRYAPWSYGGNTQQSYADVEAVRVRSEGIDGPELLLREAWERFGLPMAMSEVHLGGHREEQVRWLLDSWTIAQELRDSGIDLRAITAWSLLGSFDWNSLCRCKNGCYEPGVFDVRGASPRPTAIARAIQQLARQSTVESAPIPDVGWWRTDLRFSYAPVDTAPATRSSPVFRLVPVDKKRPLLILGSRQSLGLGFVRACKNRRFAYVNIDTQLSNAAFADALDTALTQHHPWAVVNAETSSDGPVTATQIPVSITALSHLAVRCASASLPLLTFSSEHVFDGTLGRPYVESDTVSPLSAFGRSQWSAERTINTLHPQALVVRTSALFSPWNLNSFLFNSLRRVAVGEEILAPDDCIVSPTYVPELVDICLDLLVDAESGLWHIVHRGAVSWTEFLKQVATSAGLADGLVCGGSSAGPGVDQPPRLHALASQRGQLLPSLSDAIGRFCRDVGPQWLTMQRPMSEPILPVDYIQEATS